MSTVTQIETAIKNLFGVADGLARETKFVQRVHPGKLTGKSFAATQVLGLVQRGEVSMSDLGSFATHLGVQVSGQAIDQRFTEATATFFREVLNVAFTQVVAADPVAIPLLGRFTSVIVEESSTFSLPDDLQALWKGCGGRTAGTLSAFKIQVRWDLLSGGLTGVALQAGCIPDTHSDLKERGKGRKSVGVRDLGYFDTALFEKEGQQEEYYLTRYKPGNLKVFDEQGHELHLVEFLQERATGKTYECWVQVGATRRLPARLIAIPVPEEVAVKRQQASRRKAQKHSRKANPVLLDLAHWTLVLTNIPSQELSSTEALVLLRLRWQIELLYKLWKQQGQADTSRSQQPWHMLCDYYAKLLGMLIVHWVMIVGCWQIPSRSMVKASSAIRSQVVLLAKALGGKLDLHWVVLELLEGLDRCRMNSRLSQPNAYQLALSPHLVSAQPPPQRAGPLA